jgi:hypothetical protein
MVLTCKALFSIGLSFVHSCIDPGRPYGITMT